MREKITPLHLMIIAGMLLLGHALHSFGPHVLVWVLEVPSNSGLHGCELSDGADFYLQCLMRYRWEIYILVWKISSVYLEVPS